MESKRERSEHRQTFSENERKKIIKNKNYIPLETYVLSQLADVVRFITPTII